MSDRNNGIPDSIMNENACIEVELIDGTAKDIQLMHALDQVMNHFRGVGVGMMKMSAEDNNMALDRFKRKWAGPIPEPEA